MKTVETANWRSSLKDVEAKLPGHISGIREWFRWCPPRLQAKSTGAEPLMFGSQIGNSRDTDGISYTICHSRASMGWEKCSTLCWKNSSPLARHFSFHEVQVPWWKATEQLWLRRRAFGCGWSHWGLGVGFDGTLQEQRHHTRCEMEWCWGRGDKETGAIIVAAFSIR